MQVDTTQAHPLSRRPELDQDVREATDNGLDELVGSRRGIGRSWDQIRDEIISLVGWCVTKPTLIHYYPEYRERP